MIPLKTIYLDHAATTPVAKEVLEAMLPYFSEKFGNASSLHSLGREAEKTLTSSRNTAAKLISAEPKEIIFTAGGTESNNMAIKGAAFANKGKKNHIITTPIEHHAILHPCEWLGKNGFRTTCLPVDKYGLVSLEDLENAITKETLLVSVMWANNEIGTIEPIAEIGKLCRDNDVLFHTDAVQAFGKIPVDVKKCNVDLLSASSHKIYGPKGVGLLYAREGVKLEPIMHGGGHEMGMRSGTENVSGIVGFAKACELARKDMDDDMRKQQRLRDMLIKEVTSLPDSWLNGHPEKRLPNNAHFSFRYIEGESLILYLDMKGIAASTGSACSSKSLKPSHVLTAIGLKPEEAHGSLRTTLGRSTTEDDIRYTAAAIRETVETLRKMSPLGRRK